MLCKMAQGVFIFNTPEAVEFIAAAEQQMGSHKNRLVPSPGDQRILEGNQQQQQREVPDQA
eukprot:9305031-Prorocentrum_lima.AAC.1